VTGRRAALVVVGLGRIGRLHADNLAGAVRSAELAGVVDAVAAVARSVGERHGVPWTTSLERPLGDPNVDAIVVAAPTGLHAELVERAAVAGKHVLCEKPLGFDVEAGRRAVAACREAGVALQVGFQRRFDPGWRALKDALAAGQLGELQVLRCSHRDVREPQATGALGDVFVDVGVHDLDAALWLGGEVSELFAVAGAGPAEAAGSIVLRFESGPLGLIDVGRRAAYGFECSAELVGTRATVRLGDATRVELLNEGRSSFPLARSHAERHAEAYVAELDQFGETALGGPAAGAGGDDAVAALRLAQLASRSAAAGEPLAAGAPLAVA
jgi:myo-inositol 2-dehydrogenase/D-chiro-inositol 1-dehydrogenase